MRELGLAADDEKNIVSVLEKPHGIVLVTVLPVREIDFTDRFHKKDSQTRAAL